MKNLESKLMEYLNDTPITAERLNITAFRDYSLKYIKTVLKGMEKKGKAAEAFEVINSTGVYYSIGWYSLK